MSAPSLTIPSFEFDTQLSLLDSPVAPNPCTCQCSVCISNRFVEDCFASKDREEYLIQEENTANEEEYVNMSICCECNCEDCFASSKLGLICHCMTEHDTSIGSMIEGLTTATKFMQKYEYEYDYIEAICEEN
jgi:hypothetical protein